MPARSRRPSPSHGRGPSTPRPPQKPKRTALQPRRYDPSPGPPETNMPSLCTGMAAGTAHSQGGPASYFRAPFSRRQITAQAGLSGFILWGRGVTLCLLEGSRPRVLFNPRSARVRPRTSAQPAWADSRSDPRGRHRGTPWWRNSPIRPTVRQSQRTSLRRPENLSSQRSAYFVTARGE